MTPFTPPPDYARVKKVHSFSELVTARFEGGINALCWPRRLPGDFGDVVAQLGSGEGITPLEDSRLLGLSLSAAGKVAVEILLEDQRLLREHGLAPSLDCIYGYPPDEMPEIISTDVFSFHADSAMMEADTYLCTYHGPTSEGLRNEEARRHIDIPETRAELLHRFGGKDDDEFLGYLEENCFDLHYAPAPQAVPFSFGIGNLWRIAVDYPCSPVPPCIHRAPRTLAGETPRLLLIS